jgi:outer membrane protein OmpA-like peptidoglycan-associated protein
MASGGDVKAARRDLNEALKELNDARVAAGLPPVGGKDGNRGEAGGPPKPPEGAPKSAETPPPPPPPQDAAHAAEAAPPQPDEQKPPRKRPPPQEQPPANAEQPPSPPQPPKAEAPPPPPSDAAPPPVKAEEPQQPPKFGKKPNQPQQADTPSQDAGPRFDREGKPRDGFGKRPGEFGKRPPRFDEPKDVKLPPLPETGSKVREGQELEAAGGRTITREGGQIIIRHDDDSRFEGDGRVKVEQLPGGASRTTVMRRNGTSVVTLRDRNGDIIQRYRQLPNGEIVVLIGGEGPRPGNRPPPPPRQPPPPPPGGYSFDRDLPPIRVPIPRNDYIVESQGASARRLEQTLAAPPVERIERRYSLDEVRRSARIRDKMRRIDVDTITFDFGQASVPEDQIRKLEFIGQAITSVLDRNPSALFLIEGHTDAVGSDLANLALSDRRAESVAEILSYYFDIPPENLITQGYGEQFLKIPTQAPERENRRVTLRNITPLLSAR